MSRFYIMKAYHLTTSGRKLGLKKIMRDEPNCTIVVATREYGYNKSIPVYIIGAQSDYGVKTGDNSSYTIDTGNGYKGGGQLTIEGQIQVTDGVPDVDVTGMDNRSTWVMK